jgi:hypothetical protein
MEKQKAWSTAEVSHRDGRQSTELHRGRRWCRESQKTFILPRRCHEHIGVSVYVYIYSCGPLMISLSCTELCWIKQVVILLYLKVLWFFFFFFLAIVALCMLGKCSTTWAIPPVFFFFYCLSFFSSSVLFLPGLAWTTVLLLMPLAYMTSTNHHTQLFYWGRDLANFLPRVVSNHDFPDFCLPSSWGNRHVLLHLMFWCKLCWLLVVGFSCKTELIVHKIFRAGCQVAHPGMNWCSLNVKAVCWQNSIPLKELVFFLGHWTD